MFIHTLGEHFTRHCCEEAMCVFVRSYYFAAAQVLSKSVYNALVYCDDETTLETRKFVTMLASIPGRSQLRKTPGIHCLRMRRLPQESWGSRYLRKLVSILW